uniref:VWFA domain-containing protein n=1 Tax=Panagrolaimus davidi TaxID=227884 RepID=A0A914QUX3_9BILA
MQQLGDYRLRRQFAAIATALSDISNSNTQPIGSLVFISDTTVAALDGAEYYMDKMPNVKITFVLLGPDADQSKLTNFSSNFITWRDLSQPQPDNWNNLYGPAYGCSGPLSTLGPTSTTVTSPPSSSTVIPTSTSVSSPTSPQTSTIQSTLVTSPTSSGQTSPTSPQTTTTGTTPAVPFIPCQSWISFGIDDSNVLQNNDFMTQLNFISSAIGNITHPERIAAIGGYSQPVPWNSGLTISQIQTAVTGIQQSGPYSLRMQFAAILTNVKNTPLNNIPVGALIFISDTSTAALQGADQLFNQLKNVTITFVLLGNSVDSSKLTQFSSNFIAWKDLSQSQPDNWNNLYGPAYGCVGGISTLSPTSTGTTITPFSSTVTSTIISSSASSPSSTVPSSSTIFSTQSTSPTSPTTPSDYIPCHSWISFNIDDSNTLSTDNYNKQLNFISAVIGDINHPERIQAIGAYDQPVFWNSPFSIADIQTAVKALPQEGAYRLRQQLAELLTGLESIQTNNAPVGALIFISDTSDAALQDASAVFSHIQNVRITFVLLGPNTDQNKLTNFSSNFINWKDLSQPLPDNWSNLYGTAYGCSEGISTVSPISTVTTILTSSSSVTSPTQTVPSSSSVTTASQAPITSTTGSTPSAGDYVPCQVLITTLVDISNALSIDQFQKQLTFTKNFITEINHPERIQYGAYYEGNGNMTYKWNDTNTQAGLLQAIDDTKQTSLPTSLAGAMRVLSNNAPQNRTIPDSTIIFVTDTTNSIQIQQAVNLYNSLLKARGVRLTFILAGNKTDATALSGFNDTIIFNWQNMNISQPVGWDLSAALRCTGLSSTTTGNTISVTSPTISTPGTATSVSPSTLTSGLSTSIQSSTTTSSGYIPCQSWISFGIDDSNVLQNNDFMTQLNFVSSAIGNITHTERIAAIGAYSQPVTWNSGLTISQIQQAVVGMFQAGPYSLKQQFAAILTNLQSTQTGNTPIGALIFISDTSDQALADVANTFGQLQNVRITFVSVGNNVDQTKLTQFSNNFISWRDLSKPQPDNWDAQAAAAYGCTISTASTVTPVTMSSPSSVSITRGGITVHTVQTIPPQTSSSASTSTSATSVSSVSTATGTAITTPESYMPCQSWIGFLYDDSNVLSYPYFKTQISFISTVIGSINYPDRLLIQGDYTEVAAWNSHQTIPQLQAEINNIQQTHNTYLLKNQFANLATNVNTSTTTNWPVGALIFISDTSDAALVQANVYFANIPSNFLITFVLLGQNADSSKLTNFSSNFISWSDLSKPQPDSWNNSFYNAYGCNGVVTPQPSSTLSTASPSSTQSTTVTLPSTSSPSTASSPTTAVPPTQSTLIPYIPCQSWISFSYDDSSSLSVTDFETQTAFIANAINSMTYPDRIRANAAYTGVASWNSHQTILQMQNELNSSQPTSNTYSLLLEFAGLLTDTEAIGTTNWPIGALVFISDTSPTALDNANIYFSQLPPNVRLTFVLLGNKVDQTKLTQFSSNFIYWSDLSQPQPDNWDALSFAAYGCSAKYIL